MMKAGLGWAAALAVALAAGAGQAAVVHDDAATNFTGTYRGVGSFDVSVLGTGGSAPISFDIFGARSVDGDNSYSDLFTVALNDLVVFTGTFNMSGGGANKVFTNLFGWTANTLTNPGGFFKGGVTSVAGNIDLLSGLNKLTFGFSPVKGGNQGTGDESWAINKVDIIPPPAPVPLPAALPLLALATAALGAAGLRQHLRRRSDG
jgi:hypothetical protein